MTYVSATSCLNGAGLNARTGSSELRFELDSITCGTISGNFALARTPCSSESDAPAQDYYANNVYYDSVQPNAKAAAIQLKEAMGQNTDLAPLPLAFATYEQEAGHPLAIVVVGAAFGGELVNPQAHIVQVTPRQPPNVRNDPGASLSLLQGVRAKAKFPLMVPHVIESSSNLSSLEPVRAFKPAPFKHEVALTYVTGAGNVYWDVIETDWADAPILKHETTAYTIAGRKYHFFTTSGHIHMIVFYKGKGSYWVVNTLRDELSNETMIAIAKGLAPLGK